MEIIYMRKGAFYNLSDYEITAEGVVINKHNGHIVKPQKNDKGYLRVSIGKKLMFVHRLVAQLYVPNPENKEQVNHIDGNKLNNSATNLEWATNQENRDHAVTNGLHLRGDKCPYAKLTQVDVDYIRNHPEISSKDLAKQYNVWYTHINSIRSNKKWKN
jgi:hypothetical protein